MEMYFLISQPDFNTSAIIILLLVVIYFVADVGKALGRLRKKTDSVATTQYLNTTAKLKAIEMAPNGIITFNTDGIILSWNKGAENIFGFTEAEAVQQPLMLIVPPERRVQHLTNLEKYKQTKIITAEAQQQMGQPIVSDAVRKDGKIVLVESVIWQWKEGVEVFFTAILKDITAEQTKKREFEELLEIYKKGEDIDDSGVWSWDVLNDKVYSTPGFDILFDIERSATVPSSAMFLRRVYHEDRKALDAAIKKAFDSKEGYDIEYRVVTRDGSINKLSVTARTFLNGNGDLVNITGVCHLVKEKHNI